MRNIFLEELQITKHCSLFSIFYLWPEMSLTNNSVFSSVFCRSLSGLWISFLSLGGGGVGLWEILFQKCCIIIIMFQTYESHLCMIKMTQVSDVTYGGLVLSWGQGKACFVWYFSLVLRIWYDFDIMNYWLWFYWLFT